MLLVGDPNCDQHRIWPLQTLEIIEKILLDRTTLKICASFRELKKPSLSVTLSLSSRAVRSTCYPNTFTALKELKLRGDPPALREVLQLTSPPHLQSLDLNFDDWSCSTHDEGTRCTHAALSAVNARTTKLTLTFGEDGPRVVELIQPAPALHWLTEVRITLERHIPELVTTDAELRALADAWPALTVLEFDLPRARTLVRLAARHPRLERLVLHFLQLSGDALLDPDALDELFPLVLGLQRFRVRSIETVTEDARANEFALFLDCLFPHQDFTCPEPCYDSDWHEIERLLIVLEKARRNA
ncbi:hypothetical protein BD413DRAFT_615839 [Trametes elegans]|nr:hypothetical protein BD413DRAFT_615839 [Trametes elegans]